MRRILQTALALLVVALWPSDALSAKQPAAKCQKHRGETVIARSKASVVTRAGQNSYDYVFRGCLFARGHRYTLVDARGNPYFYDVLQAKLAGPYVALTIQYTDQGSTAIQLGVHDRRNGRGSSVTAGRQYSGLSETYTLERLVLSKHGAVAWRGTHGMGYPPSEETAQKVTVADSHGTRELDSAAPGALRGPWFRDPSTVTWPHDGPHSAPAFYGLPRS
jgi:hypothetical protein